MDGQTDRPTNWRQTETEKTDWDIDERTGRQTDRPTIKANATIWFLDSQNIVQDTKITIVSALVQKLWPKTRFHEMAEIIMYP